MARMVKKVLLLGLAGMLFCCTLGCSTSKKTAAPTPRAATQKVQPKPWGVETQSNITKGSVSQ